jgi:hypothetical protein
MLHLLFKNLGWSEFEYNFVYITSDYQIDFQLGMTLNFVQVSHPKNSRYRIPIIRDKHKIPGFGAFGLMINN